MYIHSAWKDLLTGYGEQTISYDAQGNPTSYLGHTLTWEKGRQLKTFDNNTYTYNANGIRTGKTVNGVKHTYILDGANILRETWGSNTLEPIYDNEESVCGIMYNDEPYYFRKNLQGDVIAIADKNSQTVARYAYDAWGVPTITQDSSACQIATINPYRYRSYYYDEEICMYYLQSRYYNPIVGRWFNTDDATYLGGSGTILGYSLFTYCENNSIMNIDLDGHFIITSTMLICAGIGALVFGIVGGVGGYHLSKRWKIPKGKRWKYVLGGVVIGAVVGALIGGAVGYVIGPSTSSGIVLWSGNGNASVFQAAKSFAKKNGLRILEKTRRGKILTKMQNKLIKSYGEKTAWKIMNPLFNAASEQFAKSANGTVHVFLNASGIRFESTFLTIEYWILREMGIDMVFHFID